VSNQLAPLAALRRRDRSEANELELDLLADEMDVRPNEVHYAPSGQEILPEPFIACIDLDQSMDRIFTVRARSAFAGGDTKGNIGAPRAA
jgi:hypothetical protein